MKSERRHELGHNELAEWLNGGIESIKPYVNTILGVIVLVFVLAVGTTWYVHRSAVESAEAWDGYYNALSAGNPDELAAVAADYPRSRAARWAEAVAADMHLNSGCNQLFNNRADANIELDKAAELYKQVLKEAVDPVLLDRATYGLARTNEAMGDLEEAKKLYEQVTQKWPGGPFAEISAHRLKELQLPSTLAFYDEFEKFDPKPAFADEPGIPGAGPLFDDKSLNIPGGEIDSSALPNLDLESMKKDNAPKDSVPKEDAPKDDAPKEEAK